MTTLITQNASTTTSSASATVVLPTWTVNDEDLILIVAWCNTGTAAPLTKATSSNGSANPINEVIPPQLTTSLTFRAFWYYAASGDSGSTVTIPFGASTQWSVQCRVYQSSFFGAVQFKNGSTAAASCTFTAFTPGYSTSDGAIVVEFAGNVPASGVTTTFTTPTNYVNTQHTQSGKASSVNAASWSGEIVTAGTLTAGTPHTPATVTTSNTARYQTVAFEVLPTSLAVPYVRGWHDVSNNTGTATAASISCTVPSGMDHTKDTIIAFLTTSWAESGVAPTDANITPATGFSSSGKTPVTRDMGGSSAYLYTQGFYKHPTVNDTGTYTFAAAATVNSGAFNSGILTACVVRNLGTSANPFGAVHSTDTASAASLTLSFTPAANGTLVLGTVCRDDTQAITTAGLYTNGFVEAQGAGFSDAMISWFNQGTAAATGTQTFTISGGSDSARVMMFELVASGGVANTKSLTGGLSFTGSQTHAMAKILAAAALTLTGSQSRAVRKLLTAAAVSFTGAAARATAKLLTAAALSFTGSQTRRTAHLITAALSFTGSQSHALVKLLTAGASFTGTQVRAVTKLLAAAALTFTGSLARSLTRALAGALSFTGSVTTLAVHHFTQSLTGALSFTGSQSRSVGKLIAGGASFTGSQSRAVGKRITAAAAFTGTQTKAITKSLTAGGLSFAGAVTKSLSRALSGGVSFAGTVTTLAVHHFTQALTATLSFTGSQTKRTGHLITAGVSFTGSQTRRIGHLLTAGASFTGSQTRAVATHLTAALTFAGSVTRSTRRALTAALTFTGAVATASVHHFTQAFTASVGFTGTVAKRTGRVLAGVLGFLGGLVTHGGGAGPKLPVTPGGHTPPLPGITDTGHTSGTVGSSASGSSLGAVTSTASPTKPVTGA